MDDKYNKGEEKSLRGPSYLFFLITLIAGIEYLTSTVLPRQSTEPSFSIATARNNLKQLTSFGAKTIGSEANEIIAPSMLMNFLSTVKSSSDPSANIEVEVQRSSNSFYTPFLGGFNSAYSNLTNVVVRVSWPKTEAELELLGVSLPKQRAVLINAHFDSYFGNPGASDDTVGIVAMIEVFRAMTRSHGSYRNPVIFLFNGGEEAHQTAAHGFITKHRWAKEVKFLINIEAIGSGGREMVFQSNSGWLMQQYGQSAPHPRATVIASELFRNILWKTAATDWSTFINYGPDDILGLDMAYIENGYVYHSSFDRENIIPDGTIINTFDNLLAFTRKLCDIEIPPLASSLGATDRYGEELAVFYDVLNYFYVSYSGLNVLNYHVAALLFGFATIRHLSSHSYRTTISSLNLAHLATSHADGNTVLLYIPMTMGKMRAMLFDELLCVIGPMVAGLVTGTFAFVLCPMRWYAGGVWMACLMYLPPSMLSALYMRGFVAGRSHNDFALRQIAAITLWTFLLGLSMVVQVMSGFICCWWIVCTCAASLGYHFALKHSPTFSSNVLKISFPSSSVNPSMGTGDYFSKITMMFHYLTRPDNIYSYFMCPAICIWIQIIRTTVVLLLPLLGKSGTVVPADPAIGALIGILVGLSSGSTLANVVCQPMKTGFFRKSVLFITVVFTVLMFGFPTYTPERPKRLWMNHVERVVLPPGPQSSLPDLGSTSQRVTATRYNSKYASESGIWIGGVDSLAMTSFRYEGIHEIDGRHASKAVCVAVNGDCYFKFPWYFPVAVHVSGMHFIPTVETPELPSKYVLHLVLESAPIQIQEYSRSSPLRRERSAGLISYVRYVQGRRATIRISGPDHMNVVLRESPHSYINRWVLLEEMSNPMEESQLTKLMTPPSPLREDNVRMFQIVCGGHNLGRCSRVLVVDIAGDGLMEVAAYGHYVAIESAHVLQALRSKLPSWSRGAEWINFPSVIITGSI